MSEIEDTSKALADVAGALIRAAGSDLLRELKDEHQERFDALAAEARRWLRDGFDDGTNMETEDKCAEKVLELLGLELD